MIKNNEGKKLTGKQLLDVLNQVITQDSILISDEFKGYNTLGKKTNHISYKFKSKRYQRICCKR